MTLGTTVFDPSRSKPSGPSGLSSTFSTMSAIYGIREARSHEIRYVGKTSGDPARRLRDHRADAKIGKRTPLACWLRKHPEVEVVVLERDPVAINEAERAWIALARSHGCRLLNVLDGGEGWTPGRPQSAESNRKRSETQRGRKPTEGQLRGLELAREAARDPECRRRAALAISAAKKGVPLSEAHRRSLSEAISGDRNPFYGRSHSEESKRKMSASHSGVKLSPEHREKISRGRRVAYQDVRSETRD